jgi:hypothetical protein
MNFMKVPRQTYRSLGGFEFSCVVKAAFSFWPINPNQYRYHPQQSHASAESLAARTLRSGTHGSSSPSRCDRNFEALFSAAIFFAQARILHAYL